MALGVSPTHWAIERPTVEIERWTRILDLAWMLWFLRHQSGVLCDQPAWLPARLAETEHELATHLPDGITAADAIKLHSDLGDPGFLLGLLVAGWTSSDPAADLLLRYFDDDQCTNLPSHLVVDGGTAQGLAEPITVRPADDAELLEVVQQGLLRYLAQWQTTIELCVSSNQLIGGLAHPMQQPPFHIRSVDRDGWRALPVTINSDDPLIFASRLADEFAYAWAGMVLRGNVSAT